MLFLLLAVDVVSGKRPNVVYVVTDDQDQMLGSSFPTVFGGETPMPKTKKVLVDEGLTFSNFFIHVPICNPSRSCTLTGKYFHNVKTTETAWSAMHVKDTVNNGSFAMNLQAAGYTTGLFGKYLNAMPDYVPLGWDMWHANDGGTYVSPTFHLLDGSLKTYEGGYTTSVVGNATVKWLKEQRGPYFAYVAPKAAHEPFNPAPWYVDFWKDEWPATELRPEVWNCSTNISMDHGSNIPNMSMLTDSAANIITGVFRNRWRTLMSVDDLIESIAETVDFEDTFMFFTSDHGFQLGQFNILMDKRHVYDWDTRIHLVVRGPGVKKGSERRLASNVDLAPTFFGLASISKDPSHDGRDLSPLLFPAPEKEEDSEEEKKWPDVVFMEYYYVDDNVKCVADCQEPDDAYPRSDANCIDLGVSPNENCWSSGLGAACKNDCYPTENLHNNFIALRILNDTANLLYVKYQYGNQTKADVNFADPDFIELFDVATDPWMAKNLYSPGGSSLSFDKKLMEFYNCQGDACRQLSSSV